MAVPHVDVDLVALAETDVRHPIAASQLLPALQTPPFVLVPGLFNTRDLGLVPLLSPNSTRTTSADDSSSSEAAKTEATTTTKAKTQTQTQTHGGGGGGGGGGGIRPGFLYRTGSLDQLPHHPQGQALLRDHLRVRRIFDLRSRDEHARGPDPVLPGIEGVWQQHQGDESTTEERAAVDLRWFVDGDGVAGYVAMYLDVLDCYAGVFREVLLSVRDRPAEPILFHCTAGRDRTGVLAGLLESLAGYDAVTIRTDFLLSRIGYEPAREQLLRFALEGTGITAKSDLLAASSSSSSSSSELTDLFDSVPGFWNLTSLKPVYWDAFVQAVNDKFVGGFAGYVTSVLGFGEEDLATIRRNLAQAP